MSLMKIFSYGVAVAVAGMLVVTLLASGDILIGNFRALRIMVRPGVDHRPAGPI